MRPPGAKDGSRRKAGASAKTARVFWAHVVIDAIRERRGRIIGFAKITRDITERREAQEKLEKTREALLQSQKMEAIGQLTGGIAHDFNNLLMAVLGSLELMRKRLPDDPRFKRPPRKCRPRCRARRGADQAHARLCAASGAEFRDHPHSGAGARHDRPAAALARPKSIIIETRFPLALKPIRADANQLEMALLNLAVNARDAMPQGGQIIMAARDEVVGPGRDDGLKPGRYVCLASATPASAWMRRRSTARWSRFSPPRVRAKAPGWACRWCTASPNSPADALPYAARRARVQRRNSGCRWPKLSRNVQIDSQGGETHGNRGSLVVVAVDDDPLVLLNTVAMLEDLGHQAYSASSGKQALDILRREGRVDVVVTDQAMPHMTGVQLAQAIAGEWPELPVVLATGYAEVKGGGAAELRKISKPFTQNDLAAELAGVPRKRGTVVKFPTNGCSKST